MAVCWIVRRFDLKGERREEELLYWTKSAAVGVAFGEAVSALFDHSVSATVRLQCIVVPNHRQTPHSKKLTIGYDGNRLGFIRLVECEQVEIQDDEKPSNSLTFLNPNLCLGDFLYCPKCGMSGAVTNAEYAADVTNRRCTNPNCKLTLSTEADK